MTIQKRTVISSHFGANAQTSHGAQVGILKQKVVLTTVQF